MSFKKNNIVFLLLWMFIVMPSLAFSAVKNGVYDAYYSNGNLRMRTKYKKGVLRYKKIYFKNGKLRKLIVYKGRLQIKRKTYYENGQLQSVWTKKSGVAKYYAKDGRLKAVVKDHPGRDLVEKLPDSLL